MLNVCSHHDDVIASLSVISENELIDLTGMAYGEKWQGILPSAGGCDEFIRLYMFRRVVTSDVLSELEGRLTGYVTMHTTEVDPVKCKPVSAFFRSAALFSLLYADSLQTVLPDRYTHTFKRLRQEGERIKLHIVPLEDMWKMTPDAKVSVCFCVYAPTCIYILQPLPYTRLLLPSYYR